MNLREWSMRRRRLGKSVHREHMNSPRHGSRGRRALLYSAIMLGLSAILAIVSRLSAGFSEWYATSVYPIIVTTVGRIFGAIPYSIAGLLLIFAVGFVLFWVVTLVIFVVFRFLRSKTDGRRISKRLFRDVSIDLLCVASTALFVFTTNAGINYNRQTLLHGESGISFERTPDEEWEVVLAILDEFNERFPDPENQITTDEDGVFMLTADLSVTAPEAMRNLASTFPRLEGVHFPRPKPVRLLANFMSDAFLLGFYFPWTVEANYNDIAPDADIAVAALHELAHVAGFMREDEANFLAFMAGRESDCVELQYAAYFFALTRLLLCCCNESAHLLPDQMQRDLSAQHEFWWGRRFSVNEDGEVVENSVAGAIADVSEATNDVFLQAQGQEGIESYGRMVDLIFAWELSRNRGDSG